MSLISLESRFQAFVEIFFAGAGGAGSFGLRAAIFW